MANFTVVGLEAIERQLLLQPERVDKIIPDMLNAGADVIVEAQQEEIERMGLVDTGDMLKSIKKTPVKKSRDGGRYIVIAPQGKDRKGVSNATKGFVAQYGRSNMPARPWMTVANEKAAPAASAAMRKVWEEKNNG